MEKQPFIRKIFLKIIHVTHILCSTKKTPFLREFLDEPNTPFDIRVAPRVLKVSLVSRTPTWHGVFVFVCAKKKHILFAVCPVMKNQYLGGTRNECTCGRLAPMFIELKR